MKKLIRQTDLKVAEILSRLKGSDRIYPKCLLLNELGAACKNGEDADGLGEKVLISSLNLKNRMNRVIAFCCLSLIDSEKYDAVLINFRNQSRNKTLLSMIDRNLDN